MIRRARPDESEALTRIAHAAKRHWGYPERWLGLWREALTVTPDFIERHEVYAALRGDEVLGFYALAGDGDKLELEHLWVAPEHIGGGIGRALLSHAISRAAARQATALEIAADPNAEGFYRRMGARRVGEVASEIEGQPRHLPLLVLDINVEPTY
jgi:ribosomal protein S18 acetylase RimI-like enzyme